MDLFIRWQRPQTDEQRFVTGCRILRGGSGSPPEKGLPQTAGYMDVCAAIAGSLAIFNRSTKPWRRSVPAERGVRVHPGRSMGHGSPDAALGSRGIGESLADPLRRDETVDRISRIGRSRGERARP